MQWTSRLALDNCAVGRGDYYRNNLKAIQYYNNLIISDSIDSYFSKIRYLFTKEIQKIIGKNIRTSPHI